MQDMFDESMGHMDKMKRDIIEIYRLSEMFKRNNKIPVQKLTGQITDLAACKDGLPKSAFEMLDPQKKEMLIKNFERLHQQGLIEIDTENQTFELTYKGSEYIKKPEFKIERQKDLEMFEDVKTEQFGVEMTGTDKDLLFFKSHKELNLGSLDSDNATAEMKEKFFANINNWSEKGLTSLDQNGAISLTAKGKELIGSKEFMAQFGGNTLAEKGISAIPGGQVVVVVKEVATAISKTTQAANTAAQAMGG